MCLELTISLRYRYDQNNLELRLVQNCYITALYIEEIIKHLGSGSVFLNQYA